MVSYILAENDDEYFAAKLLFRQYAAWLNIDLGFQHFEEELLRLQDMYGFPSGGIILTKTTAGYIACTAIRKLEEETAELKRMYVQPAFQRSGVGQELLQQALTLAKKLGYKKLRLDTLNNMLPAINLYKKNGFYEIPAYYYNPQETAVYFEKLL